jgi:hypothetical protein
MDFFSVLIFDHFENQDEKWSFFQSWHHTAKASPIYYNYNKIKRAIWRPESPGYTMASHCQGIANIL